MTPLFWSVVNTGILLGVLILYIVNAFAIRRTLRETQTLIAETKRIRALMIAQRSGGGGPDADPRSGCILDPDCDATDQPDC